MAHAAAQVEVEDTGLDPGDAVDGVNLQYTVELRRDDTTGVADRRRAAGEPGPAPPGDERAPVARAIATAAATSTADPGKQTTAASPRPMPASRAYRDSSRGSARTRS